LVPISQTGYRGPHSSAIGRVDVKQQIDLEICDAGQKVVAKSVAALAIQKPAHKPLDPSAL
jgi:hypothetical protein